MTNPQIDTNNDGIESPQELAVWNAKTGGSGSGSGSSGDSSSKSKEDYPVLFRKGAAAPDMVGGGTQDVRKTKTEAIAAYSAGTLNSGQKRILDNAYAKYKAAGGRAGKKGWWTDYVNAAADTGESPFDIVIGQYGSGTDNSGANNYTSGSGKGASRTSVAVSMYSPELANQILDAAVTATFGTSLQLTDQQRKDFYAKLTAGQKQGTVTKYTSKGSTTTTSFDEEAFRKKYIGTILESVVAKDDSIDLEGDAGAYQDTLLKYADDMGLMKGRREINSYVKEIIGAGRSIDDVASDMRKQAGVLYSNFADRLNADPKLTVRDLVNPYLQVMADTLEIDPNTVKLTDSTIQNAISGTKLRSLSEFQTDMRNDPRFATTKTAKRESVDFAQSLLRSFGFGA